MTILGNDNNQKDQTGTKNKKKKKTKTRNSDDRRNAELTAEDLEGFGGGSNPGTWFGSQTASGTQTYEE